MPHSLEALKMISFNPKTRNAIKLELLVPFAFADKILHYRSVVEAHRNPN